jgi:sucrose phosphorylase
VRLDAFGYSTKKKGTNCFFVQPDVWHLLHFVQDTLLCDNTEMLCEVHDHYVMQKALSEHHIWAYDFCLPLLSLQVHSALKEASK